MCSVKAGTWSGWPLGLCLEQHLAHTSIKRAQSEGMSSVKCSADSKAGYSLKRLWGGVGCVAILGI